NPVLHSFPTRRSSDLTGIKLDASGNFQTAALVGCVISDASKLGAWLTQPITDDDHVCAQLTRTNDNAVRASGANIERILRESSRSEEYTSELQSRENL